MELVIKNCNSIDEAKIKIEENRLNIKYGINGTGKSTIAKAIELYVKDKNLKDLTPFKHLGKEGVEALQPSIEGAENLKYVSIFNDTYIDQFMFQQNEVIKNSFDIFIKNQEYNEKTQKIENLISGIKETFKNNEYLEQVINDLRDLSDCFGKSKTGYSAAGSIGKGFSNGNKIANIPSGLESYSDYLNHNNNVKWIDWHNNGSKLFINISDNCPYCTSPTQDKKSTIELISKEFDAKSIEHQSKVLTVIERLGLYFSDDTNEKLIALFIENKIGLYKEEISYLIQIKNDIDTLKEKLTDLKEITFFTFNDVGKVVDKLKSLEINLDYLPHLNSIKTQETVNSINESLTLVSKQAGLLQGEINKQKEGIRETIREHKEEINKFLKFAGYKYIVDIENDDKEYKMRLKHEDSPDSVKGEQCLSYGESNAFSLVLFMYESLAKNTDLIILDDPISSFDKNKKFAIIEMLFRGKKSFKGKTVLMMTHDLEPIVDMVKVLPNKFEPAPKLAPVAHFLKSIDGIVSELEITKNDVITFAQVCEENTKSQSEDIIKLIYLRRYYEIINDKNSEYQLLSNLFHKRDKPVNKASQPEVEMTDDEIEKASSSLMEKVPSFNYQAILAKLEDRNQMLSLYKATPNFYEKLQLFRIIDEQHNNDVIRKYINETFHIENEYIMQLNPCKYEIIPQFIIKECDLSLAI